MRRINWNINLAAPRLGLALGLLMAVATLMRFQGQGSLGMDLGSATSPKPRVATKVKREPGELFLC